MLFENLVRFTELVCSFFLRFISRMLTIGIIRGLVCLLDVVWSLVCAERPNVAEKKIFKPFFIFFVCILPSELGIWDVSLGILLL